MAKVALRSSLIQEIEEFIAKNEIFEAEVMAGQEMIVETYAHTITGFAQNRAKGISDPTMAWPQYAWIIPVRRITGAYYAGWKDQQLGAKTWRVYNLAREAYYIEFGINPWGGKHIRRPVLKLAVMDAIEFYDGMKIMSALVGGAWESASVGAPHLVGGGDMSAASSATSIGDFAKVAKSSGSVYLSGTIGVATRVAKGSTRVLSAAD